MKKKTIKDHPDIPGLRSELHALSLQPDLTVALLESLNAATGTLRQVLPAASALVKLVTPDLLPQLMSMSAQGNGDITPVLVELVNLETAVSSAMQKIQDLLLQRVCAKSSATARQDTRTRAMEDLKKLQPPAKTVEDRVFGEGNTVGRLTAQYQGLSQREIQERLSPRGAVLAKLERAAGISQPSEVSDDDKRIAAPLPKLVIGTDQAAGSEQTVATIREVPTSANPVSKAVAAERTSRPARKKTIRAAQCIKPYQSFRLSDARGGAVKVGPLVQQALTVLNQVGTLYDRDICFWLLQSPGGKGAAKVRQHLIRLGWGKSIRSEEGYLGVTKVSDTDAVSKRYGLAPPSMAERVAHLSKAFSLSINETSALGRLQARPEGLKLFSEQDVVGRGVSKVTLDRFIELGLVVRRAPSVLSGALALRSELADPGCPRFAVVAPPVRKFDDFEIWSPECH